MLTSTRRCPKCGEHYIESDGHKYPELNWSKCCSKCFKKLGKISIDIGENTYCQECGSIELDKRGEMTCQK